MLNPKEFWDLLNEVTSTGVEKQNPHNFRCSTISASTFKYILASVIKKTWNEVTQLHQNGRLDMQTMHE